jgi:radical SAM protein with 4Fe4S-binding SPASM domain
LETEVALKAIDDFAEVGVKAITLVGGGEPLFHKNVDDILTRIVDRGIEFGVITNLSIIPPSGLLNEATWIRVSVDAASDETYKIMHRPRGFNFSQLLKNVENLAGNTDLGVSFLVHKDNFREIADAARLFKKLGASYIQYKPVYDEDRATNIVPYLDKINGLLSEARRLDDQHYGIINLIHRVEDIARPVRNFKFCRVHHYNTQLAVDGKIYPCCVLKYIDKFAYGSLYQEDFKTIWNGPQRQSTNELLLADDCPPCWYDKTNEVLEYLSRTSHRHANFV